MEKISVLMPVYNSERFLKEAIDSVLKQTYNEFEFIIINDGSTDKSKEIIESYNDKRIKLINNKINRGIVYSLNEGLKNCTGKYVIRMDSDDISEVQRFQKQVDFMNRNPNIAASGTYIKIFGENIRKKVIKNPINMEELKVKLLFTVPIFHPTAIFRREVIQSIGYEEGTDGYEDYILWQKLITLKYEIANIPEILLNYRIVSSSITQNIRKRILEKSIFLKNIYKKNLENILPLEKVTDEIVEKFTVLSLTDLVKIKVNNKESLNSFYNLIELLLNNNYVLKRKYLLKHLSIRWVVLVIVSNNLKAKHIFNKYFILGMFYKIFRF